MTNGDGRFVGDLRKEDFAVYEDEKLQTLTPFTHERVPVSLGILPDASGSMNDEKLNAATSAINHLVFDLLEKDDELFFVQFGFNARLTQEWTTDRKLIRHALVDVNHPTGDTALYDAIARIKRRRTRRGHRANRRGVAPTVLAGIFDVSGPGRPAA